jgi:hypothetical protein
MKADVVSSRSTHPEKMCDLDMTYVVNEEGSVNERRLVILFGFLTALAERMLYAESSQSGFDPHPSAAALCCA